MAKRMLIDALHPEETRVVIADENQVYDFDFVSSARKQLKGNIYLAKITRVEPSLQAAFVEYGGNKQGFLPFSEIHADYYQIPMADRKRLMEEAERETEEPETPKPEAEAITVPVTEITETAVEETSLPAAIPEMPENSPEHPAYLTAGAIDVSISEEVEPAESDESVSEPIQEAQEMAPAEAAAEPAKPDEVPAEVETLPNEEEEVRSRPKRNFFKRYKIQEVIRRGQIVLVQVIKEERGNKGASLTTYLSLPGRYCVLMPNSPKDGGVSRKIASQDDRKRLKAIYQELKLAAGMSVIIRTAGMDRTRAEIKRDYDYLVKLWNQIRQDTLNSSAPALIYEESDIIKRSIRDQYTNDIDEVIIEGDAGYKAAKEFMKLLLPSHTPKVKHYKEATPLFYAYNIEDQLLSMHDPVVKLRSGGYIVINPTEALISIDVNSGRSTGERNIEETATKTNLEAAAEVARQLRLRDLAGLIVIDFIDMMESRNRRAVEKALRDALKADRAKLQLGRISPFGLLEMSRQRLRPSVTESNMVQCPHCIGRGVIRSNESMSIQMIRAIEKEASSGTWGSFRLIAPQAVTLHLLNHKRDILRAIEQRYEVSVQVLIGPDLTASEFNLEKMRRASGERQRQQQERRMQPSEAPPMADAVNDNAQPEGEGESVREDTGRRGRRGRRGGRNRQDRQPRFNAEATPASEAVETGVPEMPGEPMNEESRLSGRPPRRERGERGGRGRRRWRERRDGDHAPREREFERPILPDSQSLPAFATEAPVPVEPPVPPRLPEPVVLESTPRDPNAPPKKGWWQKMIELDD